MIKVTAPGKIILFGEHAVVYDKLGIACTINRRCNLKISPNREEKIIVISENLKLTGSKSKKETFNLTELIEGLIKDSKFDEINRIYSEDKLSPVFFIIGTILKAHGFYGLKIKIESDVIKNLGSSSAVFSALSFGILKFLNKDTSKKEVSGLAFKGDIMAHGGTPSGVDNSIVTYGGYLKYRKSEGIESLNIDFKIPILIVDSLQESKTAEMVSWVRENKSANPRLVNSVLDSLENISQEALKSLISKDLRSFGELMYEYYFNLKKLNISTERLDEIIKIALKKGALGSKPTGGWGGGCCLVLADNEKKASDLMEIYNKKGFFCFKVKTGVEGTALC